MFSIAGFAMTCLSVLAASFNIVMGVFMLFIFATCDRRTWNTSFMSSIFFYIVLLIFDFVLLSYGITTFLSDIEYRINTDSIGCRILAHLLILCLALMMNGFLLEAFVRCCIVVYRRNTWLRSMQAMFVFIGLSLGYSFGIFFIGIPLYNVKYDISQFNCSFDMESWKTFIYIAISMYTFPVTVLIIIYTVVVKHMRRSTQAIQQYQQKNTNRDFYVLTRVVILTFIAAMIGLPSVTLCVVGLITGQLFSLIYRIEILSFSIGIAIIEVGLILINPQLKSLVVRGMSHDRVVPITTLNIRQQLPHLAQSNIVQITKN